MWNAKAQKHAAGSKLSIDYVSFEGILDDYDPEANKTEGTLELNLDEVVTDLTYPIASPVDGLIQDSGAKITGLSDNVVTLLDTQRTEDWSYSSPGKTSTQPNFPLRPISAPRRSSVQMASSMVCMKPWILYPSQ